MEGTIGEIRMFAADFAPRNWQFCNNQLLQISTNAALFSILGTTYGGNGVQTFALPDLRGRTPVGTGSTYDLGEITGIESATITANNLPSHNHAVGGSIKMLTTTVGANAPSPVGNYFANDGSTKYNTTSGGGTMKPANTSGLAIGVAGNGQGPTNLMPYLAINYIICLQGIFPSRN